MVVHVPSERGDLLDVVDLRVSCPQRRRGGGARDPVQQRLQGMDASLGEGHRRTLARCGRR